MAACEQYGYRVDKLLGRGAFGSVVRATKRGDVVAIKHITKRFRSWNECLQQRRAGAGYYDAGRVAAAPRGRVADADRYDRPERRRRVDAAAPEPSEARRGAAAAASWTFREEMMRRRRGRGVDISAGTAPRRRGNPPTRPAAGARSRACASARAARRIPTSSR